jgi:hypothetical protein
MGLVSVMKGKLNCASQPFIRASVGNSGLTEQCLAGILREMLANGEVPQVLSVPSPVIASVEARAPGNMRAHVEANAMSSSSAP